MRIVPWLWLWSGLALAQENEGRIEGHLMLEDGQPVRYVVVVLVELDQSTLTGEHGRFVFSDVPAGSHT
ncbi:MAG TPA: hypothetical protein VEK15_23940, partial [Vicinamibacteria bacterium]|nr:hypothetical protein [Vicinamibacteria bacterium]